MEETEIKDPKQLILDASASLFALKGFAAVGVREIAAKANVNISMISYYYGSKGGILKAIIKEYYDDQKAIILRLLKGSLEKGDLTRAFVKELIGLIRKKEDLCMVAMLEFPFDMPDIIEYKIDLLEKQFEIISETFHMHKKPVQPPVEHMIIGPLFMGMIFSHFLVGNIVRKNSGIIEDDEFYDKYAEIVTTIFLEGVREYAKKKNFCMGPFNGFENGNKAEVKNEANLLKNFPEKM